jgi:hypothetical protein
VQVWTSTHFGVICERLGFRDEHGGFIRGVVTPARRRCELLSGGYSAILLTGSQSLLARYEIDQVAAWDQANSLVP